MQPSVSRQNVIDNDLSNLSKQTEYEIQHILLFFIYALYFEIIGIYLQSLKEGRNIKLKKWQIINHR